MPRASRLFASSRVSNRPPRYIVHPAAAAVDRRALERTLRARVRGEVRFDAGARAAWSTDASNFRMPPIGVVQPRDVDDVIAAVAACREHRAPITNRGGGTSLSGETTNVAVVLDTSRYVTRLEELDPDRRYAWVEPGIINDQLREAAQRHHLTFGPDPSTHDRCTIGGNLGNNSCGTHSVMAGRTADNTLALDVLCYDGTRMTVKSSYTDEEIRNIIETGGRQGEIFRRLLELRGRYAELIRRRYPTIPRRVSGYNLDDLLPEKGFNVASALVGTEGTCVTILRAKLRLVPWPRHRSLLVLGYPDIAEAADHAVEIRRHGPMALEAIDDALIRYMRILGKNAHELALLPEGSNFLLVEFGGETKEEADEKARACMKELEGDLDTPAMSLFDDERQERTLWEVREGGLGAEAQVPNRPLAWPGWEDSAVDPAKLGPYLRELRRLYAEHGYDAAMYGHFGDGCVHATIPFDLRTAAGVADYRRFIEEASDLVVSFGGSLSGEHGDGQQRAELLEKMYGPELVGAMQEFKAIWDPDGLMNPGKVVDPVRLFRLDENLRLGTSYKPWIPRTRFAFPRDDGSFERAALRCVGTGKCRVLGGQVMCPSYQTVRREEHSTRGRARLLFEMLQGDVVTDGWRSKEVFEALDLCLSCKGCKSDCPVGVDMATYKAEFLSHYYERRLRPRHAYAMGLIMYAARFGSHLPRVANWMLHGRGIGRLVKWIGGIHPQRIPPRFANPSFRAWFHQRQSQRDRLSEALRPRVVLFPDTFTNYFHTDVAQAVHEVLEAAGFTVVIPRRIVCCGRPLFDYGMLDLARRLFRRLLAVLDEEITAGVPVVVPEPSCCAALRDELLEMLPHDPQARRLAAQTYTLEEFLCKYAPDFRYPRVDGRIVVQQHCHHRAVMGTDAQRAVLQATGAMVEFPETGCCGLAGSWGFEKAKHDLSLACGERVLFPLLRDTDEQTVVVADGFSCRTQIFQGLRRPALHTAQVLRDALRSRNAVGLQGEERS